MSQNAEPFRIGRDEPNAHVIAHETIREPAGHNRTQRHRQTEKLLLRRTTKDLRLHREKALERLRAYCPAAEAGAGRSARRPPVAPGPPVGSLAVAARLLPENSRVCS